MADSYGYSQDGLEHYTCCRAAGQTSELFFIWRDSYERGGRYDVQEFDLAVQRPMVFGGTGDVHHAFFTNTSDIG